jgi:hypothetical protein
MKNLEGGKFSRMDQIRMAFLPKCKPFFIAEGSSVAENERLKDQGVEK